MMMVVNVGFDLLTWGWRGIFASMTQVPRIRMMVGWEDEIDGE